MLDDLDLQARIDALRSWSPQHDDDRSWAEVRRRSIRKRRRGLAAVGIGALAIAGMVGVAASVLSSAPRDGSDVETRGPGTTTTAADPEVSTTTLPPPAAGAFDHLSPGWHDINTGPVPDSPATVAWSGREFLVATGTELFGYDPVSDAWREFPSLPFDEGASVAIVSMDGPLLAVAEDPGTAVRSAVLDVGAADWRALGEVPNGYPADIGIDRGPGDQNYGTSLVWTGERVVDSTHGAVFDPVTAGWSPMPLPDDLVAFTQLLYANPVWDGHRVVLGYPHSVPGLAYTADVSDFAEFDGVDPAVVVTSTIGPGFSVPLGEEVFFVRDGDGFAATYSSQADEWTVLPPVPGVRDPIFCPAHAASLGDSVVVAPCAEERPVYLVDGAWDEIDLYAGGPCCSGQWLGADGALIVWGSGEEAAAEDSPQLRVWVPPREPESTSGLALEPGWTKAPASPLSARTGAAVATVSSRVFVMGGWAFKCPPAADCTPPDDPPFADGAVLDLDTGEWNPIADAPIGFRHAARTVVGGDIYLLVQCEESPTCPSGPALLRYRTSDDAWDLFDAPTDDLLTSYGLTTFRGALVAYATTTERGEAPDYIFDPSRPQWSEIAADPLPLVFDRRMLEHGQRLLVFGSLSEGPVAWKVGASFDPTTGRWTELPDSGTVGFQVWRAGDRAFLNPHFRNAPGGVLDLDAMEWSPLPELPTADSWRNDMAGVIGSGVASYGSSAGWIFDADNDVWIEVPQRPGGEETFSESLTTAGERLVVYGGERWTESSGELLDEMWIWTPPDSE